MNAIISNINLVFGLSRTPFPLGLARPSMWVPWAPPPMGPHFLGGPHLILSSEPHRHKTRNEGGPVAQGCGFAISLFPRPLTESAPLPWPHISQPPGAARGQLVRSVASRLDFARVP